MDKLYIYIYILYFIMILIFTNNLRGYIKKSPHFAIESLRRNCSYIFGT